MSSQLKALWRVSALLGVALLLAAPGLHLNARLPSVLVEPQASACCSSGCCCCQAANQSEPLSALTMPAGCACEMNQSELPVPVPFEVSAPTIPTDQIVASTAFADIGCTDIVEPASKSRPETEVSVNSPPLYLTSCTFLI